MDPEAHFAAELDQIRATYRDFRADRLEETLWAPLARDECDWRGRQLEHLCGKLRAQGLSSLHGQRVLDFGCGRGRHLRLLIDLGADPAKLDGIDLDPVAVEEARRLSPNLRVQLASGVRLPYPDSEFDLVTQFVVFSSLPSPGLRMQVARELDRVLRPGGLLFWWDMDHMAAAAGGHAKPLDPRSHFPSYAGEITPVAQLAPPGEALRPIPLVGGLLRRAVNALGHPTSHHAALLVKPSLTDASP